MSDILSTAAKSAISVALLFLLARLMGKKQMSQLTFFDYVAGISIGSIAAAFAVEDNVNYVRGITGLIVYALFPILLSLASIKSYRGRKLLDGTPTILIRNGQIVDSNLVRVKMTVNDLLEECRLKDVFDIADVEFGILETSGKLSIQLKAESLPPTAKDMNITMPYKGLCTNLIIDGNVIWEHLKLIGRDTAWLMNELKNQNASDVNNILLAYLDTSNQLHIHRKGIEPKPSPLQ